MESQIEMRRMVVANNLNHDCWVVECVDFLSFQRSWTFSFQIPFWLYNKTSKVGFNLISNTKLYFGVPHQTQNKKPPPPPRQNKLIYIYIYMLFNFRRIMICIVDWDSFQIFIFGVRKSIYSDGSREGERDLGHSSF